MASESLLIIERLKKSSRYRRVAEFWSQKIFRSRGLRRFLAKKIVYRSNCYISFNFFVEDIEGF